MLRSLVFFVFWWLDGYKTMGKNPVEKNREILLDGLV